MNLIIDGNNNLYRAYYKFNGYKSFDGEPTGCTYGFIMMTLGLIRKFKPKTVVAVFDSGRSPYRMEILPEYKAKRENKISFDTEAFYAQRDTIIKLLPMIGVDVVYHKNERVEGDDIIYSLRKKIINEPVTIISRDKDFNQLVNYNTFVFDSKDQITYTPKNIKQRIGYKASQLVDYLTLLGDDSDNIPGYRGMGEKRTLEFLNRFTYINRFLNSDEKFSTIDKELLMTISDRNRKLIDLRVHNKEFEYGIDITRSHVINPNLEKAKKILHGLDIKLLTKEENISLIKKFLKP